MESLSVALTPGNLSPRFEPDVSCAVVIDVLRATSVMTTAVAAGAKNFITCQSVQAARDLATSLEPSTLLCGERACERIEGFDFGNSPTEYTADRVDGRTLVLTTTNGTRAIAAVENARRLLIASFLNLTATLDAITDESHVDLVCAGTDGQISYEDVLLAGAIVDRLFRRHPSVRCDDSARIARACWRDVFPNDQRSVEPLEQALRQSLGGRNLTALGYDRDIRCCAEIDLRNTVVQRKPGTVSTFERRVPPRST